MQYVVAKVPELKLESDGKETYKTPPVAALSVSLRPASRSFVTPVFEFAFDTGALINRKRKRRRWLTFLSLGLARQSAESQKIIDSGTTREALHHYASEHYLPGDYVDAFLKTYGKRGTRFSQFQKFVNSKEEALKRAFGLFDVDGDGRIDASDLELSLSHVRVCCPTSNCTFRCRQKCIKDLVAKVDMNNDNQIEFWEFRKFFMKLPSEDSLMEYWLNSKCSERCDVGGCVVIHDGSKKTKGSNPWGHLFAGASAGAVSRTATAPLETLRLSAMTGAIPSEMSPVQAVKSVCRDHGWKSLYKGNLTNVLRSAPQKALDFFAFDTFKRLLGGRNGEEPGIVKTFAAAGLAGATSNVILYPLEVVRSRLTVDAAGQYKGVLDAFGKIAKTEGVGGLYHGVGPSVAAILPEAAIVYGLFDLSKKSYRRVTGKEPGLLCSLSFGVWSAFMGQVVAYPLETVSRRMQVQGMKGIHQSFASCFKEIIEKEGGSGLYRGLSAASARVVPMALVSFGTYELVRRLVREAEDAYDRHQAEKEYHQHHQCVHLSPSS